MLTLHVKNANAASRYADDVETMGQRIRALREAQGMSQEQLGRACGVSGLFFFLNLARP